MKDHLQLPATRTNQTKENQTNTFMGVIIEQTIKDLNTSALQVIDQSQRLIRLKTEIMASEL